MAKLSISAAWDGTASFVKNNLGSLFTVAFALVALPSVALQALGPGQVTPGQQPEAGAWLLLLPVVLVLSIAGTLAIAALAVGRENVVGRAIGLGFRRFLPVFAATLLIGLAAMIVMIPLVLLLGIQPDQMAPGSPGAGRVALAIFLFLLVFIFIYVRLMLLTPVAAAESAGPIQILRRSWRLTAGHFWKLLGFVLLLVIVAFVLMMVATFLVGIVVALVAGRPDPGSVSSMLMLLLGGVLNAVFVVYFTTMLSRIYLQLAEGEGETSGT